MILLGTISSGGFGAQQGAQCVCVCLCMCEADSGPTVWLNLIVFGQKCCERHRIIKHRVLTTILVWISSVLFLFFSWNVLIKYIVRLIH